MGQFNWVFSSTTTTSTSSSTMKLSAIALLAFLAISGTSALPTCEECKFAMDALVTRLTGEASIAVQMSVLVDTICPQAENPDDCVTRLTAAWPEIAGLIFNKILSNPTQGLIYPRYLD